MSYATNTSVPESRSREELQFVLEKFGADQFMYTNDRVTNSAVIGFRYKGAHFIFRLPLATDKDKAVRFTPAGKLRPNGDIATRVAQENRRRWRSLALTIKAMLIGVEDGIFNFAQVFMPYMVWGDGRTTWEALLPVAEECCRQGRPMVNLSMCLPAPEDKEQHRG